MGRTRWGGGSGADAGGGRQWIGRGGGGGGQWGGRRKAGIPSMAGVLIFTLYIDGV